RKEKVGERRKVRVRGLRHQVSGFRGERQFPPSAAVTTTARSQLVLPVQYIGREKENLKLDA
ncbi:MAG: hypothetical protein ACJ73Z_07455, partial [Rubrobacteraceae bacterium]